MASTLACLSFRCQSSCHIVFARGSNWSNAPFPGQDCFSWRRKIKRKKGEGAGACISEIKLFLFPFFSSLFLLFPPLIFPHFPLVSVSARSRPGVPFSALQVLLLVRCGTPAPHELPQAMIRARFLQQYRFNSWCPIIYHRVWLVN